VVLNFYSELLLNVTAFWDIVSCSLIGVDQHFRCAYCLHHQADVGGSMHHYYNKTTWHYTSRRLSSSYSSPWKHEIAQELMSLQVCIYLSDHVIPTCLHYCNSNRSLNNPRINQSPHILCTTLFSNTWNLYSMF
jgi:hypothetical protein